MGEAYGYTKLRFNLVVLMPVRAFIDSDLPEVYEIGNYEESLNAREGFY